MVTYRKDETQRPEGWNKGAPPHVGWWLAKDHQPTGGNEWRFWCGQNWSIFCSEKEDGADGNRHTDYSFEKISWTWTWTWPQNARVSRVNPETGEVTGSGPCPYETSGQAWPFGEVKKKAADAPKLKKKPAGNRKVTRYVVMDRNRFGEFKGALAVFCDAENARLYAESCDFPVRIQKIRFRTPEA